METDMLVQYTNRGWMQMTRAFKFDAVRKLEGASTRAALRGTRNRGSHRGGGGAMDAKKTPGLGCLHLQSFVAAVVLQRLLQHVDD